MNALRKILFFSACSILFANPLPLSAQEGVRINKKVVKFGNHFLSKKQVDYVISTIVPAIKKTFAHVSANTSYQINLKSNFNSTTVTDKCSLYTKNLPYFFLYHPLPIDSFILDSNNSKPTFRGKYISLNELAMIQNVILSYLGIYLGEKDATSYLDGKKYEIDLQLNAKNFLVKKFKDTDSAIALVIFIFYSLEILDNTKASQDLKDISNLYNCINSYIESL